MIQYDEALAFIKAAAEDLKAETLPIAKAQGYISAEAVYSQVKLPSFDNSAMDGFALRACDTQLASLSTPVSFKIVTTIAAGDAPQQRKFLPETTCEIMTGAMLPTGLDAVVRIEDVTIEGDTVHLRKPLKPGENIRYAGEDFDQGSLIMQKGSLIQPEQIMALAALGVTTVQVIKKPIVRVITTGSELVHTSNHPLESGKIYNSNGAYLDALFQKMGVDDYQSHAVPDDAQVFIQRMKAEMEGSSPADLIITTGGVSAGKWDFVPEALKHLGAEIIFHKVNIRPGKPILFAKLGKTCIFALPGNPVSMTVGYRFFIEPLLCAMQGLPAEKPIQALLTSATTKKTGMRHFWKARLSFTKTGQAEVEILSGQESFKINPLLKANAWVILEAEQDTFPVGKVMAVYPLYPLRMTA